ncbi:acyl-CoA dehydrogenase family protein [Rhizorhabdus dicambivorans]|nr:acyl-CoA dehydrogenase family protein [Rhizorhabdus dicambivorans]
MEAAAFPEALASGIAPIAELADRIAADVKEDAYERLEAGDRMLLRSCIADMGDLGLLGAEVPVKRGGAGLSTVECCRIAEALGPLGGFSVAYAAHSGLATTPLASYADDALAGRYLPRLMSGEWIGGYCLTEPGSGSDAQAAKARAVPVEGGWRLSGTKAWISNGGIADLFVVFAQFMGEAGPALSACVVERGWAGVSIGAEERKLGMASSSTTTVSFDEVFVPEENLIGLLGMGARIAFGTLNSGRMKIGAVSVGVCRDLLRQSRDYAGERQSFGSPIIRLAAVKEKLAVMAARTFALEAVVYRVAATIDADQGAGISRHEVLAGRQAEAALVKVLGSETLAYCADEAIQIHGGNGFSEEYRPARAYRDARVQRIYEGTNEINRALAVRAFVKRWRGMLPGSGDAPPQADRLSRLARSVLGAMADTGLDEAAATPAADIMLALIEAESALLRARHVPDRPGLARLAELAALEAERRALDAGLRLPPAIRAAAEPILHDMFAGLAQRDRAAAIAGAADALDDPVFG